MFVHNESIRREKESIALTVFSPVPSEKPQNLQLIVKERQGSCLIVTLEGNSSLLKALLYDSGLIDTSNKERPIRIAFGNTIITDGEIDPRDWDTPRERPRSNARSIEVVEYNYNECRTNRKNSQMSNKINNPVRKNVKIKSNSQKRQFSGLSVKGHRQTHK